MSGTIRSIGKPSASKETERIERMEMQDE